MKVFKFGGASLKDAAGVRNVASIVAQYDSDMIVVASAMGKMTNLLEALAKAHFNGWDETMEIYEKFRRFHLELAGELFGSETEIPTEVFNMLSDMENRLRMPPSLLFDFEYDQFVCYGELLSSLIVSLYLETAGMTNRWVDIRSSLRTDDKYRDASVNWKWTRCW